MSKRRAAILSVVIEGRTQAETARQYEVSESTVSRWVARYRAEGDTAFQARSRRPRTAPAAIPDETVELVVNLRAELSAQGLDAGPHTIAWHLQQRHQITVSPSTIRRRLVDLGLVESNSKKRPKSSYVRFQADLPNEMWQSDFTHWRLATGADTEIITGSTTTPATHCPSPCIGVSPARSLSTPSTKPVLTTGLLRPRSLTTPWSTPPGTPVAKAAATPSKPASRP